MQRICYYLFFYYKYLATFLLENRYIQYHSDIHNNLHHIQHYNSLFLDQIEVVVHPQSLIHSLVRTNDGELYAQISEPDMKHPILCALNWPENKKCYMEEFDLFDKTMSFFKPRMDDFPLLSYAFECVRAGKCYPIAFNAANEIAVGAFIDGKINYPSIARIVRSVLDRDWNTALDSFETVFDADSKARSYARELI